MIMMTTQKVKEKMKKDGAQKGEPNILTQLEVDFLGLSTVQRQKRGLVKRLASRYNRDLIQD